MENNTEPSVSLSKFKVFRNQGKVNWIVLFLFLFINLLVLYNSVFHDPYIGYDTSAYLEYISALSEGRLPTSEDTAEFFSPPLAFIPAAAVYAGLQPFQDTDAFNPPTDLYWLPNFLYYRFLYSIDDFPLALSAKVLQLMNVVYSVILSFFLLKICDLVRPGNSNFKTFTLFLLLMLPVYFKTFAFVRAEPLVATIVVVAFFHLFSTYRRNDFSISNTIILGLLVGLGMLTRQWFVASFLSLFIGLGLLAWRQGLPWQFVLRLNSVLIVVAVLIFAPFYLHLTVQEGSPFAFNLTPSQRLVPSDWSSNFSVDLQALIEDPLRSSLGAQILPVLYSETWGDYWGYFVFYARDKKTDRYIEGLFADSKIISPQDVTDGELRFETNRYEINSYLGRVNTVSIIPAGLFFVGFLGGLAALLSSIRSKLQDPSETLLAVLTLFIIVSGLLFLAFLLVYTNQDPSTIKATYIIHIFPFVALLGAEALSALELRNRVAFMITISVLVLVFFHNLPVLLTRHVL